MKNAEILEMTNEELELELEKSKREIYELRFLAQSNQLEDSSRIRTLRRNVARIETERTARLKSAE